MGDKIFFTSGAQQSAVCQEEFEAVSVGNLLEKTKVFERLLLVDRFPSQIDLDELVFICAFRCLNSRHDYNFFNVSTNLLLSLRSRIAMRI